MKTISAKEFRLNMRSVFERVNAGEHISVSYRYGEPITLVPKASVKKKKPGTSPPGLQAFLDAPKKPHGYNPNKSFKELYAEHLEEKYGK